MSDTAKPAGLGADVLTSVELVLRGHKAVRELLVALENVKPDGALGDIPGRAQTTRREFETVETELARLLTKLKTGSANVIEAPSANGANGNHIHLHFHFGSSGA
jgi:hypothetical protein